MAALFSSASDPQPLMVRLGQTQSEPVIALKQVRESGAVALETVRGMWRDGVASGEATEHLDTADIKLRGRERLAALRDRLEGPFDAEGGAGSS